MREISVRFILNQERDTDEIARKIEEMVDTNERILFAPYQRDSRQVSATFKTKGESGEQVREELMHVINLNDKEVLEVSGEPETPW